MEMVNVAVLYRGSIARYEVQVRDREHCEASLLEYKGEVGNKPPDHFPFEKHGRHCSGSVEVELMDDLWQAVKEKNRSAM